MKNKLNNIIVACFLATAVAMAVLGCSWPGPHLQHNKEVAVQFDGYRIYPGYQYYTSGTIEDPRAILALKPGYILNSLSWQRVDMTSRDIEQWVVAMKKDPFVDENTFSNGAHIIGSGGEIAGYYYSVWEFPLVRTEGEKTIAMNKPINNYRLTNDHMNKLMGGGFYWD